jgi:tellurite resistance protein
MDQEDQFDTVYQMKDIIRMALLVAYSDGSLHAMEYTKAEEVFSEIADEYLGEHDPTFFTGQLERISEGLREEVDGLESEEIIALAFNTAERIEDRSSQELAIVAALRVAYGDFELDALESSCITDIARNWNITLKSLI